MVRLLPCDLVVAGSSHGDSLFAHRIKNSYTYMIYLIKPSTHLMVGTHELGYSFFAFTFMKRGKIIEDLNI